MAYKNNIFRDKTVVALSVISIAAAVALIGGIVLDSSSTQENMKEENIVDLNEEETTSDFVQNDSTIYEAESTTFEAATTAPLPEETSEESTEEMSVNAPATSFGFTSNSVLTWPVDGNIVIDYDMENTVYFPTLDLYKCSDSICIQSDVGTPVYASGQCIVNNIDVNDEIGNYVVLDLGNEYVLTYGQLTDIVVNENDSLESGDLIGYVSEPSKYYTVEGPNLYVKLTENGTPVNPLDYLNYE